MKRKILICEDDQDIVDLLYLILKSKYELTHVNRMDDIIGLVSERKPDLILMDLWIPTIGGEEAVRKIKANELTKKIPVIFVSANDKIREITERVQADAYIPKPFKLSECTNTIEKLLLESQL